MNLFLLQPLALPVVKTPLKCLLFWLLVVLVVDCIGCVLPIALGKDLGGCMYTPPPHQSWRAEGEPGTRWYTPSPRGFGDFTRPRGAYQDALLRISRRFRSTQFSVDCWSKNRR